MVVPDIRDSFASSIPKLVRSRRERIKRSNASWKAFRACKTSFKHTLPRTRHQHAASSKQLVDLYEVHLEAKLREVHGQYTLANAILSDSSVTSALPRQAAAYRSMHHQAMYKLMARLSQLKKRKASLAESLIGLAPGEIEAWIQSFLARSVAEITEQGHDDTRQEDEYGWRETNREDRSQRDVMILAICRLRHGKEVQGMRKINREQWPTYEQFWCPLSKRWFTLSHCSFLRITGAHIVPPRLSQDVLDALVGRGFDLKGPENCFPIVLEWEKDWALNKFALV